MVQKDQQKILGDAIIPTIKCGLGVLLIHEMELRAVAERQQIDADGTDVFAHLPRLDPDTVVSAEVGLVEELGLDQVHLAQVGLRRVAFQAPEVLGGSAEVAVAFDAEAFQEGDGGLGCLGEAVLGAQVDTEDGHCFGDFYNVSLLVGVGVCGALFEVTAFWKSRAIYIFVICVDTILCVNTNSKPRTRTHTYSVVAPLTEKMLKLRGMARSLQSLTHEARG